MLYKSIGVGMHVLFRAISNEWVLSYRTTSVGMCVCFVQFVMDGCLARRLFNDTSKEDLSSTIQSAYGFILEIFP